MRVFEHPNLNNGDWKCPICNTAEDKEVVLVGIEGTQEGNNMQAEQIHLDCIDLTYFKGENFLGMKWADNDVQ